MVSHTLETLPPITDEQQAELKRLAARPDSEIDASDAREMTAEEWKNPLRLSDILGKRKRHLRAGIDADILAWLKSQTKGCQARLNEILRREMLKSFTPSSEDSQQEPTAA